VLSFYEVILGVPKDKVVGLEDIFYGRRYKKGSEREGTAPYWLKQTVVENKNQGLKTGTREASKLYGH